MKRVQMRMKDTKDTRKECNRRNQMWQLYFEGRTPPHFKVPAIQMRVVYTKWRIWLFTGLGWGLGRYITSWKYKGDA